MGLFWNFSVWFGTSCIFGLTFYVWGLNFGSTIGRTSSSTTQLPTQFRLVCAKGLDAMRRTTESISQSAKQTKKEGGKRKLHKLRMLSRIRKLRYTINLMGKKDLRLRKLFPRKFEARRDRSPSTASQSSTISLQGTTISKNSQSTSNYVQRRRTTRQIPKHRPIDLANLLVGSDEEIFLVKCLLLFFLLIWFSIWLWFNSYDCNYI